MLIETAFTSATVQPLTSAMACSVLWRIALAQSPLDTRHTSGAGTPTAAFRGRLTPSGPLMSISVQDVSWASGRFLLTYPAKYPSRRTTRGGRAGIRMLAAHRASGHSVLPCASSGHFAAICQRLAPTVCLAPRSSDRSRYSSPQQFRLDNRCRMATSYRQSWLGRPHK